MKKEFLAVFQVTRTITFEVEYYTLGSNSSPYFSTSANVFNRPKTDYNQCGQCQEDVLPRGSKAYHFYKKWDDKHLLDLTESEYEEMITDLETLKNKYNYIIEEPTKYHSSINFHKCKELSMMKLKK